jgi:hypothetical protein
MLKAGEVQIGGFAEQDFLNHYYKVKGLWVRGYGLRSRTPEPLQQGDGLARTALPGLAQTR